VHNLTGWGAVQVVKGNAGFFFDRSALITDRSDRSVKEKSSIPLHDLYRTPSGQIVHKQAALSRTVADKVQLACAQFDRMGCGTGREGECWIFL
jgi:hypothetical protein